MYIAWACVRNAAPWLSIKASTVYIHEDINFRELLLCF